MTMMLHDLRYAFRQLRRAPGFTFTVAITLALSVGLATAVFCVIDAVILRPLPFPQPERIVGITTFSRRRGPAIRTSASRRLLLRRWPDTSTSSRLPWKLRTEARFLSIP